MMQRTNPMPRARLAEKFAHFVERLRRLPERLLHGVHRRGAIASLTHAERSPESVLVVCNGNLFRSPFAAATLRRALRRSGLAQMRIESAGFAGPGRACPPEAVEAAARHGVDLGPHRSQLVIADLVRAADLIIAMDPLQRRLLCGRFGRRPQEVLLLGDFDPGPVSSRAIEDPVEHEVAVCGRVYERIDRCVAEIARVLAGGRNGNAEPGSSRRPATSRQAMT